MRLRQCLIADLGGCDDIWREDERGGDKEEVSMNELLAYGN